MQVEIETSDDNDLLRPDECHVTVRDPRSGRVLGRFPFTDLSDWVPNE